MGEGEGDHSDPDPSRGLNAVDSIGGGDHDHDCSHDGRCVPQLLLGWLTRNFGGRNSAHDLHGRQR